MDATLEELCSELDDVANAIRELPGGNSILVAQRGWNCPAITMHDLADFPEGLAAQIRMANIENISEELESSLTEVASNLALLIQHTVPQINGGNASQAVPAYLATIQWIALKLQPLLYWEIMDDPKSLPPMLAKRLRSVRKQLDEVSINKDELFDQITLIKEATEAAESLPTDLIALRDARKELAELAEYSATDSKKITEMMNNCLDEREIISDGIDKAEKLLSQCEEAYRVTTTKGLAGAFEVRAISLSRSMWAWVIGLLGALSLGVYIGAERLELLNSAMSAVDPNIGVIIVQSFLSVLSLGAPLWFAWLATKQISQRFKLSEDYAFKASVAKAYEGYRREAARIDEAFEARLFSTALSRVEEAPLRLMNEISHGSPWQELISSKEFQEALENIPGLRAKFIALAEGGINTAKKLKGRKGQKTSPKGTAKEENSDTIEPG
ncbi:MAG: hypothetical protein AAF542_19470 [Pseudomonadota bacterium]